MKAIIILITPEMAKELLKNNAKNRKVKHHKVAEYAALMKAGKWKSNTGEPIKVSINGNLLDGQHRLLAVIMCGIPIEFLVTTELPEDVFDVLDTGIRRNASDTFYIDGVKNAIPISAGIRQYNTLKAGIKYGRGYGVSKMPCNTNHELLQEYKSRQDFWQNTAKICVKYYRSFSRVFSQSELIGLYAYFFDINPLHAEQFLTQLCIDGSTKVPAILYARKLLLNDKVNTAKVSYKTKLAWVFNAWNVYRSGSNGRGINYNPTIDTFPTPK